MRIKIEFKGNDVVKVGEEINIVKSYFFKLIGGDEKIHKSFSNYSVSSLQGATLKDDFITYENPYFYISSMDMELVEKVLLGINNNTKITDKLEYSNIVFDDFKVNKFFDVVQTISPILIKESTNNRYVLVGHEDFIPQLKLKCTLKLLQNGCDLKDLNGFNIELLESDLHKVKKVFVNDVFNLGSQVRLKITGTTKARKLLYTLGLGMSTGCCFGAIKIK